MLVAFTPIGLFRALLNRARLPCFWNPWHAAQFLSHQRNAGGSLFLFFSISCFGISLKQNKTYIFIYYFPFFLDCRATFLYYVLKYCVLCSLSPPSTLANLVFCVVCFTCISTATHWLFQTPQLNQLLLDPICKVSTIWMWLFSPFSSFHYALQANDKSVLSFPVSDVWALSFHVHFGLMLNSSCIFLIPFWRMLSSPYIFLLPFRVMLSGP